MEGVGVGYGRVDEVLSQYGITVVVYSSVLHGHMRNFLSNPRRIHSGQKDKEKRNMGCYELLSVSCHPFPPL